MDPIHALWTFPAIILAAMLIAWAAECGQFYISQGLALAVLAWVQTLPEFAVEAVIAMEATKDPSKIHLISANFTGSLRLFVGLGWPLVYFVAFFSSRQKFHSKDGFWTIRMDDQQSIAVLTLLPVLFYFLIIYFKGTLNCLDGLVLAAIYFFYFFLLSKMPPQEQEEIKDLAGIPKRIMRLSKPQSILAIFLIFIVGATVIVFVAQPFLDSMLTIAVTLGLSRFVFIQWVSPFLSEFPEQLSALRWAKTVKKAPMALSNFVSSSINQWTILIAMIPFIYSFGMGHWEAVPFDHRQKVEILLTMVQSYLGFLFLASMDFSFPEALGLLTLWVVQLVIPTLREEIVYVYGIWAAVETVRMIINFKKGNAFTAFARLAEGHLFKRT